MASELQRQDSSELYEYTEGDGYPGEQQSLRFRQVSSQASKQNYPQFNWSSTPEDEASNGEASNGEPKRDLRSIALPMNLRRAMREVQQMRLPVVSRFQSWTGRRTASLRKVENNCRQFLYFFSLWRKSLQKIGGNFGGGVLSYFVFLRFLVVLNFVSFFLIAGFVLAPSIVFRSVETNSTDPGVFAVNISLGYNLNGTNDTEKCEKYDPPGPEVFYQYLLDFFSGTGFMEYSYLFYGYYNNIGVENRNFSYNIPLAYILTAVFYFAFCLICIIARMGTAARVAVATGGSSGVGTYSMIVFTGWDYGCLGDRATKLKQKNILYQLQVDLEEQRLKKHEANLSTSQKVSLYSLRVFMGILSLGFIGGALFGIFVATDFSQKNAKQGILGLIIQYLPSIVITTGNFVVPLLCDQIALIEKYSPSTTVITALLRAVFLRLVSLCVLLITLWSGITCKGDKTNQDCQLCQYNYTAFPCWETRVGQEMYKLTLFDLLITVAVLLLVEFPRRFVVDKCSCKPVQWVGRQEFVVPSNVLELVYGQTVVWAGALFCPLLPAINTLKFVIVFYCKRITLFQNCRPAVKAFRSTTSTFFFLVVLLFGWGLATAVMVYSLSEIHPSYGCGPFRFSPTMWSIVPESFYSLSEVTQEFLFFIGSQAFSVPLFALSVVVMCYVIALTTVYGRSVVLLKAQLKLEGRDKQFLIKQIESLSRQPHIPTHAGVQD